NHFNHLAVVQGMRNRITDDRLFAAVDRTLIVSVVQLSRSDQRVEPRRIDVIRDLFLDDPHVIALLLIQERHTALHRPSTFQRLITSSSLGGSSATTGPPAVVGPRIGTRS